MRRMFCWAALALLLAGCDKEATLFSGLAESQANAALAALLESGIAATKAPGDEGTWNVMIGEKDFAEAATLCERRGLPRRTFNGVGVVFKKTGMVSSPSEERIRFMDAIAQDLSQTSSMIDGVVDARVHDAVDHRARLGEVLCDGVHEPDALLARARHHARLLEDDAHAVERAARQTAPLAERRGLGEVLLADHHVPRAFVAGGLRRGDAAFEERRERGVRLALREPREERRLLVASGQQQRQRRPTEHTSHENPFQE